jgi:hypothetical protein
MLLTYCLHPTQPFILSLGWSGFCVLLQLSQTGSAQEILPYKFNTRYTSFLPHSRPSVYFLQFNATWTNTRQSMKFPHFYLDGLGCQACSHSNYFWNCESCTHLVGLLGWGISSTQSRYLHRATQTQNKHTIPLLRRARTFQALDRAVTLQISPYTNVTLTFDFDFGLDYPVCGGYGWARSTPRRKKVIVMGARHQNELADRPSAAI